MKRQNVRFVAAGLILSGMMAACTGDLLQAELEQPDNPYLPEAEGLVAGLVDHALTHAQNYSGPLSDPGLIFLEAMDSFQGLAVDIDIEEFNASLLAVQGASRAGKARGNPFDADRGLSAGQKRHLGAALEAAARIGSPEEMAAVMRREERSATARLGEVTAEPVLQLSAVLQASHAYFTDPGHAPTLRRLHAALSAAAGESREAVGFIRVQDAGSDTPPTWGDHFNPGTWWRNTIRDTRDIAELSVLSGAGIGCAVGFLAAGAGCGPAAGAGGFVGGAVGVLVGGVASGISNYAESVHDYNQASDAWCDDQNDLSPALRHSDYAYRCGSNHQ